MSDLTMNMSLRKNKKNDKKPSLVLSRTNQFTRSISVNKSNNHEAAKFRRKYKRTLENNKELARSNAHLKKLNQELLTENFRLKANQVESSSFIRRMMKVKPSLSKVSNAVFSVVELLCGVTKTFDELCPADDNLIESEVASNSTASNIPNQNPRLPLPIDVFNLIKNVKDPPKKKTLILDPILEDDFPEDDNDMEKEEVFEAREMEVEINEVAAVVQNLPFIVALDQEETAKAAIDIDETLINEVAADVQNLPVIIAGDQEETETAASNIDKTLENQLQHQSAALNLNSLLAVDENVSNIEDTNTDLPPMLFTERDLEHNPVPSVKSTSQKTEPKKQTPPQLLPFQGPYFAPLLENTLMVDEDATEIYNFQIPEKSIPNNENTILKSVFETETNAQIQKRISAGPSFVPFQSMPLAFATHRPKFSNANKSMHDQVKKPLPIIDETNHDEEDMELTKPINDKSIIIEPEKIIAKEAKKHDDETITRETIPKIQHKRVRKLSSVTEDDDSDDQDPDFVPSKPKSHQKRQTKDKNFEYFVSKNKKTVPKSKTVKGKMSKTNNGKRKITPPLQKDPNRVLDVFDLSHSLNKSTFVLPVSPRPKKSRVTSNKNRLQDSSDEENNPNKTLTPHLGKKTSKTKQQPSKKLLDLETASSSEEEVEKTAKMVRKSSRTKPISKVSDKDQLDFDTESFSSTEEKKTVKTVKKSSRTKPINKVSDKDQLDFDTQSDSPGEERKRTVKRVKRNSRTKPNREVIDDEDEWDHIESEKNTASESEEVATAVIKTATKRKSRLSKATPFVDKANIEGVKKKLLLTKSGKKHTETYVEPPKENLPDNARESIPFENPQPSGSRKSEEVTFSCTSSGRQSRGQRVNYALPTLKKKLRRD